MKSQKWLLGIAIGAALTLLVMGWFFLPHLSLASTLKAARSEEQGPNRREADGDAPEISYIDSPSPTCSLPEPGTNVCYITWSYLNVTASTGQYMITSTIVLDGQLQAYVGGFFQNSMFIPGTMFGPGFRVPCGAPGASTSPDLGASYDYIIRARETGGVSAANYGTVSCPYDIVPLAEITLDSPTEGVINHTYTFDASVLPITATLPITYTWTATDLSNTITVTGTESTVSFTWPVAGEKVVAVTAQNLNSSVSVAKTINILSSYKIFLPLNSR